MNRQTSASTRFQNHQPTHHPSGVQPKGGYQGHQPRSRANVRANVRVNQVSLGMPWAWLRRRGARTIVERWPAWSPAYQGALGVADVGVSVDVGMRSR